MSDTIKRKKYIFDNELVYDSRSFQSFLMVSVVHCPPMLTSGRLSKLAALTSGQSTALFIALSHLIYTLLIEER